MLAHPFVLTKGKQYPSSSSVLYRPNSCYAAEVHERQYLSTYKQVIKHCDVLSYFF